MSAQRHSDQAKFEDWYIKVSDRLTQQIVATIQDPVLGREAAAEAFARAYRSWSRVSRMENPEGWVHRTAVNLSRRWWRRRNIERRALAKIASGQVQFVDGQDRDSEICISGHHLDDLQPLVNELPDRMRTAVHLRYWDGLSEAEVAERMSTSVGSASATLSTARRRLATRLDDQLQDETGTTGSKGGPTNDTF